MAGGSFENKHVHRRIKLIPRPYISLSLSLSWLIANFVAVLFSPGGKPSLQKAVPGDAHREEPIQTTMHTR